MLTMIEWWRIRSSIATVSTLSPANALSQLAGLSWRGSDAAGRPIRQIELCPRHLSVVVDREKARGLEIVDHREGATTK
jgi:hypothetical protein